CKPAELDDVCAVINDAAVAYRGIIAADRWRDPYMPTSELRHEVNAGVLFWGAFNEEGLIAVMGLQHVHDVALIRHAYTRTASQGAGIGTALLIHVGTQTDRAVLVGTWAAATWAIRLYQNHGVGHVGSQQMHALLRQH